MNIQKLMKQAQEMQSKLGELQQKLGETDVEGKAGGGMVTAIVNGKGELKSIRIDEKLMTPDDKEMLEDLIVAAYNDAKAKADTTFNDQVSALTGGMGLPPGFKLPI